ncbi:hypothetical protein G8770_05475 [Aestuariicella hydrocarbonica]|uniref:Tetratricopeptide repeat protein n=1 Tax=Pseudomaricurvus hydrocarbonicus TaxID=1470433 RepID=A0A9E5JU88_9GAMM|nr:hypothetical protein [Aestuariicella hydrocarbonica]NHO64990.1 hypothetical protein [Aestuariicella hydrocarbonica]
MFKRYCLMLMMPAWLISQACWADAEAEVHKLQQQWAQANYTLQGKPQLEAYDALLLSAEQAKSAYPDDAGVLIWSGIIQSSYAGVKGGLGALKYAKASKKDLEQAMEIDANALEGSAYTSLGTLYFKVPGWPLGFGDDDKAKQLLTQALKVNPQGIDPNYFYAEYLKEEGHYKAAGSYYQKALQAPSRPGRPLADAGRRKEIQNALNDIRNKLN